MRNLVVLATVLVMAGCSKPYRTGSVVVQKFEVDKYGISDPVEIKGDVVQFIQDGLQNQIANTFLSNSKMTLATSCKDGTYELVGRVTEIAAYGKRKFSGRSVRDFWVAVEGSLVRCNDGKRVVVFDASTDDDSMPSLFQRLAEEIVIDTRKGL